MRFSMRPLAAAVLTAAALVAAAPAHAADPTGDYADFKYCPYRNSDVQSCLYSLTNSGSFQLGNSTVPVNKNIILQGGFSLSDDGLTTFYDAVGADTLSKTPLAVPGGLLGLMDMDQFGGPLLKPLRDAIAAANDVTATAELVGPVKFDYVAYLFQSGPAVTLPLRIHLQNPILGPNCYIGSAGSPVTLKLTDGTTAPPSPNKPITGSGGNLSTNNDSTVVTATGVKLVDNAFSVPAATDCGFLPLDKLLITGAVNLKTGLPSPAGKNSAILGGTTKIGDAASVRTSAGG